MDALLMLVPYSLFCAPGIYYVEIREITPRINYFFAFIVNRASRPRSRVSADGFGSLVTRQVEAYAVVGGNPAKLIKERISDQDIDMLSEIKWWEWDEVKKYMLFITRAFRD